MDYIAKGKTLVYSRTPYLRRRPNREGPVRLYLLRSTGQTQSHGWGESQSQTQSHGWGWRLAPGRGWNGRRMSRGKRRGPEDSREMREREGRRRNLVEARRHAPHPCRSSGGGRGEVLAKRLAAESCQSYGGGASKTRDRPLRAVESWGGGGGGGFGLKRCCRGERSGAKGQERGAGRSWQGNGGGEGKRLASRSAC